MTVLLVIVPSRGRPHVVAEMAQAFEATCTGATRLLFAVDDDDPDAHAYLQAVVEYGAPVGIRSDANRNMVEALNNAVRAVLAGDAPPYAVAFMGDDHRPRTLGWDTRYVQELRKLGTGLVYGDDGLQGENLPTQVAMTADIARALGWMAPPVLRHMYVDNFWRDLGVHAGCITYLRDVVVEHMHPLANKSDWDEGYQRVNAEEVYSTDAAAYRDFKVTGMFSAAVSAVRALRPAVDTQFARLVGMTRSSLVAEGAYITRARTVLDLAAEPTDLRYLLGPALQVRSVAQPEPADVVCITDLEQTPAGARAVVACGPPVALLERSVDYMVLRTRTIGQYPIALAVAREAR
jgi:hypothetical protein